jgi:hypothetical protein
MTEETVVPCNLFGKMMRKMLWMPTRNIRL